MTQMPPPPPGGMGVPPGGFPFPPPPNFGAGAMPPHMGGGANPHMYTNGPNFGNDAAQAHFMNDQQRAEQRQSAVRRVRNLRAALGFVSVLCLTKITMDSRRLYEEEMSFVQTLEQADIDCNNSAPMASLTGGSKASSSTPSPAAAGHMNPTTMLSAIQQTHFADSYRYAAANFPMASVRAVVIRALQEYETRLGRTLEAHRNDAASKQNSSNKSAVPRTNQELLDEFNSLPRQVPARLFGTSVEAALRQANMTKDSVDRGIPHITNAEAGVGWYEHFILRSMMRLGQAASFKGFAADVWARRTEEVKGLTGGNDQK